MSVSLVEQERADHISRSNLSPCFSWRTFPVSMMSINRKDSRERSALFPSQQRILRNISSVRISRGSKFKERLARRKNLGSTRYLDFCLGALIFEGLVPQL